MLAYATNREVQVKNPQAHTPAAEKQDTFDRGMLYVANVLHPGGCNAAPARWVTCSAWPTKSSKFAPARTAQSAAHRSPGFDYHLVFLHGRTSFRLTPAERNRFGLISNGAE